MSAPDTQNTGRSGSLLESHRSWDPRILLFYGIIAGLFLVLAAGLAYQQLGKTGEYADRERQQNQRRIVYPGPRGNIFDRHDRLLVGNRPRLSVRLLLDQLRGEIRRERTVIRNNYRRVDDLNLPNLDQLERIARVAVVQRYLDQVNTILGRNDRVDATRLHAHFRRELLLPFTLLDDLEPNDYAKLIERLPVNSPAQVYTSSTRHYPYGSAASHTLGYVAANDQVELENFPGEDLKTFKMRGTIGRTGVEQRFDSRLQGEAGGAIFRVDPVGNRINPPLQQVLPKQGAHLRLSLDIDLQLVAEAAIADYETLAGAAVVLDAATGEVLVLAAKPDYDLAKFVPTLSPAVWSDVIARGAALGRAFQGTYPAGSPFKLITAMAGLRAGVIGPDATVECHGAFRLGSRLIACHNHRDRGALGLAAAIEKSCNVFFTHFGMEIGPELLANEARRFHLDRPTGIEVPGETRRMIIPDPVWKRRVRGEAWVGGDTANMSIGQGDVDVTPLQMACFAASLARNETWTQPTLLHDPARPRQRTEPAGLTPEQRAVLLDGLVRVTRTGTARIFQDRALGPLEGLDVAGKTGTAQRATPQGMLNIAWMVGFAPAVNPEIAFAVMIEGDTPGAETAGSRYAGPVAHAILKRWLAKKKNPAAPSVQFTR
jgi:penicillin-binding protein 2